MAIWARYLDDEGRICEVDDGRRGLGGLLRNYHPCECSCAECAEWESPMTTEEITIGPGDVLRFQRGEATGAELGSKIAGDQLVTLQKQEKVRLKAQGMSDAAADAEAWRRTLAINRDLLRAYTRQPLGVEDALRRAGGGDVLIQDGGVNVHLHNYQVKKPGLAGPKTAEEARDALMRLVRQQMRRGPADAMLDVVSTKEGRALLDLVLQGDEEPEAEE